MLEVATGLETGMSQYSLSADGMPIPGQISCVGDIREVTWPMWLSNSQFSPAPQSRNFGVVNFRIFDVFTAKTLFGSGPYHKDNPIEFLRVGAQDA
ncbi:MAG: hypothetical protein U5N86_11275 [Planctomycetota bacterium]|nr:hypothetical protein [Planctomycetota bacterium]